MNLDKLTEPLNIEEIEFRIQSISAKGWAVILAYKDARADMKRLDDAVGALNWKREHLNNNANCIVSLWCSDKKEWVSKEDTGTESMAEKAKGLASDSFKRACFNWGIGRELYDYPFIMVQLKTHEFVVDGIKGKQTYGLKIKDWAWKSEFKDGKLIYLSADDENGNVRYKYPRNYRNAQKDTTPITSKKVRVELKPNSEKWETAINIMIEKGLTIEQIRKGYDITEDNYELLKEIATERAFNK